MACERKDNYKKLLSAIKAKDIKDDYKPKNYSFNILDFDEKGNKKNKRTK